MINSKYKVIFHKKFKKEFKNIVEAKQEKIKKFVSLLQSEPRILPPNTQPLRGEKDNFRYRLGNVRTIYKVNHSERVIEIKAIGTQGQIYKLPN